jgi:AcrR family transcriptional regulator
VSAVQATRRSQEERSAATRQLLLDATIACLIDLGYAATSTTEIVRRAGVSRGAQVHHFPTKNDLVRSAVAHLAVRQAEELRRQYEKSTGSDRVSRAMDLLWSAFTGPLFVASLELIVAARTDPALRSSLEAFEEGMAEGIRTVCEALFGPAVMRRRAAKDVVDLTIAVMNGLAFARLLDGSGDREERLLGTWKRAVRPLLMEGESSV